MSHLKRKKRKQMFGRVFLPEPNGRFDLSTAEIFGVIEYLSERRLDPFNTDTTVDFFKSRLQEVNFDPEIDFICMTGNSLILALMLSVVVSSYYSVKLLMFDAKNSAYRERIIISPCLGRKGKEDARTN